VRRVPKPPPAPAPAAEVLLVPAPSDWLTGSDGTPDLDELPRLEARDRDHGRVAPRVREVVVVGDAGVPQGEEDGGDDHGARDPGRLRHRPHAAAVAFLASRLPTLAAHVEPVDLAPEKPESLDSGE